MQEGTADDVMLLPNLRTPIISVLERDEMIEIGRQRSPLPSEERAPERFVLE